MSIRLIVKHSSIPSRRLAAASGCSRSNHFAIFSSFARTHYYKLTETVIVSIGRHGSW